MHAVNLFRIMVCFKFAYECSEENKKKSEACKASFYGWTAQICLFGLAASLHIEQCVMKCGEEEIIFAHLTLQLRNVSKSTAGLLGRKPTNMLHFDDEKKSRLLDSIRLIYDQVDVDIFACKRFR